MVLDLIPITKNKTNKSIIGLLAGTVIYPLIQETEVGEFEASLGQYWGGREEGMGGRIRGQEEREDALPDTWSTLLKVLWVIKIKTNRTAKSLHLITHIMPTHVRKESNIKSKVRLNHEASETAWWVKTLVQSLAAWSWSLEPSICTQRLYTHTHTHRTNQ